MISLPATALHFLPLLDPMPSVALDTFGVIGMDNPGSLLMKHLEPVAAATPELLATIYYFHDSSEALATNALFYAIAGPEELQSIIFDGYAKIKGIKVVACDHPAPSTALILCHIQNGRVWSLLDFLNWSAPGEEAIVVPHLPEAPPEIVDAAALEQAILAGYKPPVYSPLTRTVTKEGISVWIGIYSVEPSGWCVKMGQEKGWTTHYPKVFENDRKALDYALRKIRRDGMAAFNITVRMDTVFAVENRSQLKRRTIARLCCYYGVSEGILMEKLVQDAQDKTILRMDPDQHQAYLEQDAVDPNICSLRRCTYVGS